eukprot:scpid70638/ scgid25366/ 
MCPPSSAPFAFGLYIERNLMCVCVCVYRYVYVCCQVLARACLPFGVASAPVCRSVGSVCCVLTESVVDCVLYSLLISCYFTVPDLRVTFHWYLVHRCSLVPILIPPRNPFFPALYFKEFSSHNVWSMCLR